MKGAQGLGSGSTLRAHLALNRQIGSLIPAADSGAAGSGTSRHQTSDIRQEIRHEHRVDHLARDLKAAPGGVASHPPLETEPGDTLLGTLRGLKPAQGPFGHGHLLLVETEDGELWGMWLTAYVKAELEAQHARPGTLVGIKYLGKGISKSSGKSYNRYEVVAQDPLPMVDATELEPPWED